MIDELRRNSAGTAFRQLWVCIHAAALTEACEALTYACMDLTGGSARCISLEGQPGMVELIGSKSSELLEKMLLPACCVPERLWYLKKCNADDNSDPGKLENAPVSNINIQISSSSVIPLTVKDPRALTKKKQSIVHEGNSCDLFCYEEVETNTPTNSSFQKHESGSVVDYSDLWDVREGICPPMEESVACMEKYNQRNEYIGLGIKNFGNQNALKGKCSRYCPILLLKHENPEDHVTRL
ncbi:hypothetical protein F511_05409 [Dorcoceras hygrometricum]|uniref:Uncharacterized protein n=1 Tax=Dorcoceras hygrometricum TaxID=472368 RepID=A0A2Z7BMU7_9LAMI|nr:hypothetical protein F511_05409 [Dorcoceras hygrometricum]